MPPTTTAFPSQMTLAKISHVPCGQDMISGLRVERKKASTRLPWLLTESLETKTLLQLAKQSPLQDLLLKALKVKFTLHAGRLCANVTPDQWQNPPDTESHRMLVDQRDR